MSRFPEPPDPDDWSPMTSRPGEIYTVEGEIRALGSFMRGLRNTDARLGEHRRSMRRIGMLIGAIALALSGVLVVVVEVFGS